MPVPRFKYTKKHVTEKVNNNKLLHIFLKKKRIYNKFVDSCLNANTINYFIDRQDFNQEPFMAFSWANSHILNNHDINWATISVEFEKYKKCMYEEV